MQIGYRRVICCRRLVGPRSLTRLSQFLSFSVRRREIVRCVVLTILLYSSKSVVYCIIFFWFTRCQLLTFLLYFITWMLIAISLLLFYILYTTCARIATLISL
uniref:Uncharacterized protein n=1 Tax=Schizaphis graminum TaxID=13262 RepID=A0A2S2NHN7_SCHGA